MSAVMEAREPSGKYLSALQPPLVQHFELMATARGGVARLRELMLTLAVQGKLVQQDPSEEPASQLLKMIRAEKDRLITEGSIKRDKPLAEVGEEERPFSLPNGWEWIPLQYVGYTQTGTTPDKKNPEMYGSDMPFIKPGDIFPNRVDYGNEALSQAGIADSGRIAPAGSLLMVCIGTIGKSNLVTRACSFNQQINSITPLCSSPEYVKLFCRSPYFQAECWTRSASTTIAILNKGKWEAIPFALPPLAEQSRIVTRVEELMRLCDALEAKGQLEAAQHAQLVQTLLGALTASDTPDELADNWQRVATHFDLLLDRPQAIDALEQTILQLAVRGLLVPQDPNDEPASSLLKKIRADKDRLIAAGTIKRYKPLPTINDEDVPFELPPGWSWARFPELGEFGRGKSKHRPRNDPTLFDPPIYPVVQTGEVARAKGVIREFHSKYSAVGLAQSKLWPAGTLCITIAANIADAAVLGFDACFPDSVVGFVPAPSIGRADYFLAFMETAKTHLNEFAPATAQKNINLEILEALLVPVPPLDEMSRIVARVESLRRLCADLRQRLAARQTTQAHLAEALIAEVG